MKQELRSKILETRPIEWKKAKWFQNESLKKLAPDAMQKLKSSLVANDFIMPFHVWEENESNYHIYGSKSTMFYN